MVSVHSAKHSSMPISTAALPRSFALLESSCSSEPTLSIADSIAELRTSINIKTQMLAISRNFSSQPFPINNAKGVDMTNILHSSLNAFSCQASRMPRQE